MTTQLEEDQLIPGMATEAEVAEFIASHLAVFHAMLGYRELKPVDANGYPLGVTKWTDSNKTAKVAEISVIWSNDYQTASNIIDIYKDGVLHTSFLDVQNWDADGNPLSATTTKTTDGGGF